MPELLQNNPSSTATEANGASQAGDYAGDHLARLYSPTIEEPWFRSLFRNIQEAIHPPVLPPLQVTSKPVAVRDIWGLYGKDKKSNLFSLAIHGTVVLLLFTVASSKAVQQKAKEVIQLAYPDIAPYVPKMAEQKQQMQGGGVRADTLRVIAVLLVERRSLADGTVHLVGQSRVALWIQVGLHRREQTDRRVGKLAEHGLAADHDDLAFAGDAPRRADQMLKLGTLHTRAAARRV